jgi:thiol:disulfide interchange protein
MVCPKCGLQISTANATECAGCGVILSKASQRFAPTPTRLRERAAAPPPAKPSITLTHVVRVAIVVIAVWGGWRFVSGKSAAAQGWYNGSDGYEKAVVEQKSSGKPILLYFHTEWCGYCKRLEHDVFSTSTFGQKYGSVLKVKVNPETGSAEHSLAERYGIHGFPTVFVVTGGTATEPIVGFSDADRFYSRLQQASEN